jgi:hypothetical protein
MTDEESNEDKARLPITEVGRDAAIGYRVGCSTWGGVLAPNADTPQRRPGADPRYDET